MVADDFPKSLKEKLSQESKLYFETGTCNTSKKEIAAINPTFLEPKTFKWRISVNSCPFAAYLPLPLKELEKSAAEGIATRYCQKRLKNILTAYRQKMNKINFSLHLEDDLKFCHVGTSEKFDVIDSSTLAYDVGLANVIVSVSQRLQHHPDALLITPIAEWQKAALTVATYVEDYLFAPLSMIPTIYGLRLINQVQLGSSALVEKKYYSDLPALLSWSPALPFENVCLWNSHSLDRCLKKLENNCYFIEEERDTLYLDDFVLKCYTPATYILVVKRLAERVMKMKSEDQVHFFDSPIAPRFALARRALLSKSHSVILFTSPTSVLHFLSRAMLNVIPKLRIVLLPYENYLKIESEKMKKPSPINWAAQVPDTHYIDNFEICYNRNREEILKVSFLLPEDHGLSEKHCVALVDMITGFPINVFGLLKNMDQFHLHKQTPNRDSPAPDVKPQGPYMKAVKCRESEMNYTVRIDTNSLENPKGTKCFCFPGSFNQSLCTTGLKVEIDQIFHCEAGHRATFYLDKPEGIPPLTLGFPHPVLAEDFVATVRRSNRSIKVVLKKAVNEPWPHHFTEIPKWTAEEFPPWMESQREKGTQLTSHVAGQKNTLRIHRGEQVKSGPLDEVRDLISALFFSHSKDGRQYFPVKMKDETLWHLRLHPPIRTCPSGGPMIFLSAVDHRLSEKLVAKGKLESEKFGEDVKRIFGQKKTEPESLVIETNEAAVLLRYVLRLNSAKTNRTSWQVKNLPLDEAPFLATFLTPLYLDNPYPEDNNMERVKVFKMPGRSLRSPRFNRNICDECGKESNVKLKCCSKCKLAYYCSADCQRADWKKHKIVCKEFSKEMYLI